MKEVKSPKKPLIYYYSIILLIVLLLFGGKKIPELMRGMGRGIKEFSNAADEDNGEQSAKKQDK